MRLPVLSVCAPYLDARVIRFADASGPSSLHLLPWESALGEPSRSSGAQLLRATVTSGDPDLNQFDLIS